MRSDGLSRAGPGLLPIGGCARLEQARQRAEVTQRIPNAPPAVFRRRTALGCSGSNDDSGFLSNPQAAACRATGRRGKGARRASAPRAAYYGVAGGPASGMQPAAAATRNRQLVVPPRPQRSMRTTSCTVVQATERLPSTLRAACEPAYRCFRRPPDGFLDRRPIATRARPDEETSWRPFAPEPVPLFAPMSPGLYRVAASLGGMATSTPPIAARLQHCCPRALRPRTHTQGPASSVAPTQARRLTRLIHAELDTAPVHSPGGHQLLGRPYRPDARWSVAASNVPLCTSRSARFCRSSPHRSADRAPPAGALFGSSRDPNLVAACTNPASLAGGKADLHAYLSAQGPGASSNPMAEWVQGGAAITTPFVSAPGLLSAECVFGTSGYYLAITVNADANDPRADEITGDVVSNGAIQAGWGLHLLDAHLAMGNLVDLVRANSEAHSAADLASGTHAAASVSARLRESYATPRPSSNVSGAAKSSLRAQSFALALTAAARCFVLPAADRSTPVERWRLPSAPGRSRRPARASADLSLVAFNRRPPASAGNRSRTRLNGRSG